MVYSIAVLRALLVGAAAFATSIAATRNGHRPPTDEDLSILAGQHVIYSYPGLTPPDELFQLVREGRVGGLILFRDNIDQNNTANTAAAMSRMQQANAESPAYNGLPLLVMTDQEGGYVKRITDGGPFQSAKEMGASADPATASAQGGQDGAKALIGAGVNMNLAPVLDVYREDGDLMDQWERSFGNTSALVSKCIAPFIKNMQEKGVLATAKHFPGLGAASADSNTDVEPVVVGTPIHEIRMVDEIPYYAAFEVGLGIVMMSWATYPAMDDLPAGLSSRWTQGELRGRMGFKGMIMTDALEAGAVEPYGNWSTVALLSQKAGVDMVLCSAKNVTQGILATEGIVAGLKNGELSWQVFEASIARIKKVKQSLLVLR
ncbi:glycosyl hydrolase [Fusarium solani]|uniref:Glycosyl hydrolase n=1 Tax=Fusarium solani TaxID=169388 RepID=A0A9P9G964_FUSSL|nr:glycosyl hydrolase [Fusarium solani]KAH7234302.1 glycosyl hydrolase [Fusarium solani]